MDYEWCNIHPPLLQNLLIIEAWWIFNTFEPSACMLLRTISLILHKFILLKQISLMIKKIAIRHTCTVAHTSIHIKYMIQTKAHKHCKVHWQTISGCSWPQTRLDSNWNVLSKASLFFSYWYTEKPWAFAKFTIFKTQLLSQFSSDSSKLYTMYHNHTGCHFFRR